MLSSRSILQEETDKADPVTEDLGGQAGGQPVYKKGTGLVQLEGMGEQICFLEGGHYGRLATTL